MSSICNSSTLEIRYATGNVGVAPLIKFVIVEFEIDAFFAIKLYLKPLLSKISFKRLRIIFYPPNKKVLGLSFIFLLGQAKSFFLVHIPISRPRGIPSGTKDIKRGEDYMRWQYNHLNTTPYLHPSKELRQMYNESKSRLETESIMNHMKNHEVFNNKEYKRYFSLSQVIEEDLYGEEEDILNWETLMDCYDAVLTKKGIIFREKEEEE